MSKHSPLPWSPDMATDYQSIRDQADILVADCALFGPRAPSDIICKANAALIVKAVNSHAALVEALRFYASQGSWTRDEVEASGAPAYVPYSEPAMVDCGERARAALALAGEA